MVLFFPSGVLILQNLSLHSQCEGDGSLHAHQQLFADTHDDKGGVEQCVPRNKDVNLDRRPGPTDEEIHGAKDTMVHTGKTPDLAVSELRTPPNVNPNIGDWSITCSVLLRFQCDGPTPSPLYSRPLFRHLLSHNPYRNMNGDFKSPGDRRHYPDRGSQWC